MIFLYLGFLTVDESKVLVERDGFRASLGLRL